MTNSAQVQSGQFGSIQQNLDDTIDFTCPAKPAPVYFDHVRRLLESLASEELTFGQAHELARLGLHYQCSLEGDALPALNALRKEAALRRLDPVAAFKNEVVLVTPELFPESWEALMEQSEHSIKSGLMSQEKVEPILLGCVAAIVIYTTSTTACGLDVMEAQSDCITAAVCPSDKPRSDYECCQGKAEGDFFNCYLTGGTNGPDNDYQNCCY